MSWKPLPPPLRRLIAFAVAVSLPCLAHAVEAAKIKFDLPADVVARSLKTFAHQSGLEVLISAELGRGVRTQPVKGEFTPREAVNRMLSRTGLAANQDEKTGAMVIKLAAIGPDGAGKSNSDASSSPKKKTETMTDSNASRKAGAWLASLFSLIVASDPLAGQTTAASGNAAPTAPGDEVVELSPFTVNASADRGYQAEQSLSGSRLRTNLKDMATPITAFTEQFLLDTAITNTDDLAKYMLNTNYDLNEEANGQNGQITSIARPLKMRGLNGGDVTINFFKIGSRSDTFSTERVEQARGPNAILFGIGSAGGIVNVTTKKAKLNGNSGSVAAQVRSYDGNRVEGDYNQVLIPGKLAVRLAAVTSETGSWRHHAFNDADRLFGTLKFKPTAKAELNLEFETGNMERAVKRTFTALDAYTPWRDAGRNLGTAANAALGIASLGTNAYVVFDSATGTLTNWRTKMKTANASNVSGQSRVLTDFSVLPKETSITGPGFEQTQDYTRLMASFTYAFTRDWNLEIAAVRSDEHVVINDNQQGFEQYLYADPNPTLPNGSANPNAGRAYLEAQPLRSTRGTRNDRVRASMSYTHDFGRWGVHTVAAVGEYAWNLADTIQAREYIISANAPALNSPEAAANRIYRRTYVDLTAPSEQIVMANPDDGNTNGLTETLSGNKYQTALIPFSAGTQITEIKTLTSIAMLQSAFWNRRIHTVVGASRDERTVLRSTQVRDPLPGFTNGILRAVRGHDGVNDPIATNYAFSAVYHATDWLSLSYSQARNNDVPNNSVAILYGSDGVSQARFEAAQGKSEDMGIKLNLFQNRLSVNALYFETSAAGDNEFGSNLNNANMNDIWGALNRDGVIDPLTGQVAAASPEATNAQTFDQRAQGYEVSVIANLTPNWRLYLGGSHSIATRTNIAPEMQAHLAAVRPLWEANRSRLLSTPSGDIQTIGDMIAQIDAQAQTNFVIADGRRPLGQSPDKFNLRTTYDFTSGPMKGVSIGGGARYLGKPVIGLVPGYVDTNGTSVPFQYYNGSAQVFVDASISYRRKLKLFSRPVTWSLQLNVDNLLNNDAFVRLRVSETGSLQNYRFNDPREWILTSRFSF